MFLFILMDMHIVSWFVNGLQFSRVRNSRILLLWKKLHRHVVGAVDILLLQEHKIGPFFGSVLFFGACTT